jgi:tRNA-uridine 2-sulfurtransferase
MKPKIVIAMSGGVDSSVAAALLKDQGYDVIGISLQLWNYSSDTDNRFGTCCSLDDLADARRVAEKIKIPFYILNMEKEFRKDVVDYFVSEYMQARTPIPCTLCNSKVKFDELMVKAKTFGRDIVATGHFASVVKDDYGRLMIKRGDNRVKDQSYFLFNLTQEQISRVMFPLGGMTKAEVRDIARSLGLNMVSEKSESQEICFVPNNNYKDFIASQIGPESFKEGNIINSAGAVVGKHQGYPGYTVGQRKGLNLGGLTEPYYVTKIDPYKNEVVVGPKQEVLGAEFYADRVNWYSKPDKEEFLDVQIRYRHSGAYAKVTPLPDNRVHVEFDEPQNSVAPGQAAVFYRDDCVVGGGWIE